MGQTLTHGIYLPDEGERNCYSGLAANWQILDSSVGTIAAHTAALAGKAPLVHTHTVSQITDFPAYGNAAGTICEGNDSRLSDARTPVAHTHTKSDVTDLFNSANTWSGDQTFSAKILTKTANTEISGEDVYQCLKSDGKRAISFRVSNNSNYRTLLLGVHDTNNSPPKGLVISNDNSNNISVYSDSPQYLGTSSNQWQAVYAQSYYYNGVAWGLDKANTWTQSQTISINLPVFTLQDTIGVRNTTPANARNLTFSFLDKNGDSYGFINRQHKAGTGTHLHQVSISNGTYDYRVQFYLYTDGKSDYIPSNDGVINLGTTNNKWKTLNGINPGALSLPSATTSAIDVTNWVTNSWTANYCDAPFDGYISISCFANSLQINNETKAYGMTFQPGDDGFVCGLMPVCSGDHIKVAFVKTQTSIFEGYKFIKANGNV